MSIHRGLAELKTLDKRISRAIKEPFVEMQIGSEPPKGFKTVEEFNEKAKASFQQATDLIERRNKIKSAITASNASTIVEIGGRKMTVAEAIDRRDTGLQYDKELLKSLRQQLHAIDLKIDRETVDMQRRLDQRIDADLGSKDRKTNAAEVDDITKSFLARYKPNAVDPIGIRNKIEELTREIEQFEMEVDFVLSESNTTTKIEIED